MTTPTPSHGRPHEVPLDDTAVLPIYPVRPTPEEKKTSPWLIAAAAAAIVVGLCCGGAVIYAANDVSDTAQPTASNTTPPNNLMDVDASPTPPVMESTASESPAGESTSKPTTTRPKVSNGPNPTRPASPRPAPTTNQPKPPSIPVTDPHFKSCKEANAAGFGPYRRGVDPEYAWYRDRNGDGLVCERP